MVNYVEIHDWSKDMEMSMFNKTINNNIIPTPQHGNEVNKHHPSP
jgi:hypothetical protein